MAKSTKVERLTKIMNRMSELCELSTGDAETTHQEQDRLLMSAMTIASEGTKFEDIVIAIMIDFHESEKWYA